ncbi:hypothetical protein P4O66_003829 [Electrophorus voltai]|uniref:Teneurin N-terminal domain-containing protein n=1 Tax=Electrophorus voltai TaxID=2609070 RepID=A0AAD8ZUV7_9TELE|nr:hypothetical protein P4O66_003829 [Electrophorus voltai]
MEMSYTSSSDESEDGSRQAKAYTSRETLADYGQDVRLTYKSHTKRQTTSFTKETQGKFSPPPAPPSTTELEFGKPTQVLSRNQPEEIRTGPQHSYSLGPGSDVDEEGDVEPLPSHALHLWMQETKSEPSSCLSSRANSVLSLTDTEQERKSDGENVQSVFKVDKWTSGFSLGNDFREGAWRRVLEMNSYILHAEVDSIHIPRHCVMAVFIIISIIITGIIIIIIIIIIITITINIIMSSGSTQAAFRWHQNYCSSAELRSSPGGQFTFRPLPPPPPPPHACTCARPAPYAHVTLQRNTMPLRSQASQVSDADDGQADHTQLHNNWGLNSSIPLETRHFLFKPGSGSTALLGAASQNYPLTSNTVYSPPPRPLPRGNFSRPMFTFNKPHKCCNWKCTALSATAITVTLALLLTYVIGSLAQCGLRLKKSKKKNLKKAYYRTSSPGFVTLRHTVQTPMAKTRLAACVLAGSESSTERKNSHAYRKVD